MTENKAFVVDLKIVGYWTYITEMGSFNVGDMPFKYLGAH